MNVLQEFAANALTWLWQTSLAAAALAGIALAIQWTCGKYIGPRWTYALWMLVAVRLAMPFAPESQLSLFNIYPSPRPSQTVKIEPPPVPVARTSPEVDVSYAPQPIPSPAFFTWRVIGALLWFAGAAIHFSVCVWRYRRFGVWAKRQRPVSDPGPLQALREAQRLLGYHRDLPVLATTALRVPALFGFVRPRLLVPQTMLETWSAEELRHAFLHELIHAKRRDHLLNWALIFVQAIHWFNPVAWTALKRLRAERELLCDAIALSRLGVEQRRSYGSALIKAAEQFAVPRFSLAVVPMINQNNEVKRRVSMIAQFKPAPRLVSIAAVVGMALLACFTFTSKAQKPKPASDAPTSMPAARIEGQRDSLKALRQAYDRLTRDVEEGAALLEDLRHKLGIPSSIASGDGNQPGPDTETIKRLQMLRMEARPQFRELESLLASLSKLSGKDFGNAIATAMPDATYGTLQQRQAEAEQSLAAKSAQFGADHPEVVSLKRTLEAIRRQLDERREGIVFGLKTRVESLKARVDEFDQELSELRQRDLEAPTRYREYFKRKRELENLQAVRDRLQMRIIDEEINAEFPAGAHSPVIKPGIPASKP